MHLNILHLKQKCVEKKKIKKNQKEMRFSKSRSGMPNAFFFSSSDIILYTPGYLQMLWGTLRQFKPKRIEEKFSKIVFSVARHWILPRPSCSENTTAPELL